MDNLCSIPAPDYLQKHIRNLEPYIEVTHMGPDSYKTRHIYQALQTLYGQGITDEVLLPCLAVLIGEENAFLGQLTIGGTVVTGDILADIQECIVQTVTAVINLQIGQHDMPCSLGELLSHVLPRISPALLRQTLLQMYRQRADISSLIATHNSFAEQRCIAN
ncbi:MAG: hypothetical protein V1652_01570 [bacterium]